MADTAERAEDICPAKAGKPHCWHATGRGWSIGTADHGASQFRCCNCGENREFTWKIIQVIPDGHGKYAAEREKVYDDPAIEALYS